MVLWHLIPLAPLPPRCRDVLPAKNVFHWPQRQSAHDRSAKTAKVHGQHDDDCLHSSLLSLPLRIEYLLAFIHAPWHTATMVDK